MRLLAFTAATMTVAGFMFADVPPASADANAAVCAQTYGKSDGIACNYATHEQCRAAVSGLAGSCIDNPYLQGGRKPVPARKRRGP